MSKNIFRNIKFLEVILTVTVIYIFEASAQYINEHYLNKKFDFHLVAIIIGSASLFIWWFAYERLMKFISNKYSRKELYHTKFITSEILPTVGDADSKRFHVDEMYNQLIALAKPAKCIKLVDNTASQLDHINNLTSRNQFLNEIANKLAADSNFSYERIELIYIPDEKLIKSERRTTLEEFKLSFQGATKAHLEKTKDASNGHVYYLPINKNQGTFIIFDETTICFQIDGVDLGESQPCDLITISVDNPNEEMLITYKKRFDKLKWFAENFLD